MIKILIQVKSSDIKTKDDYLWLLNTYINLDNKECDKKVTKHNVELTRLCNSCLQLNKEIELKAPIIKEILTYNRYEDNLRQDILSVIKQSKDNKELLTKMKSKLKIQSINKEWFNILAYCVNKTEKELIEINGTVMSTLEDITGLSYYFKTISRNGIKPIDDILNNIYTPENNTEKELDKQLQSIRDYIDKINSKIDIHNISTESFSVDNLNKFDKYIKALNNYCKLFKRDMCTDRSIFSKDKRARAAGELTNKLYNMTYNKEDKINSLRYKYIIAVVQVKGKGELDVKFISTDTIQAVNIRKMADIRTTSDYRKIKIYENVGEVNTLVQMLNENIDKYIGQIIQLDFLADYLLDKKLGKERNQVINEYTLIMNRYNNKVSAENKLKINYILKIEKLHTCLCGVLSNHNKENKSANKIATVGIRRCAEVGVNKALAIEVVIDYNTGIHSYEADWYTMDSLKNNLNLDKDTKYILNKYSKDFIAVLSLLLNS